jgi:hypothetical protein
MRYAASILFLALLGCASAGSADAQSPSIANGVAAKSSMDPRTLAATGAVEANSRSVDAEKLRASGLAVGPPSVAAYARPAGELSGERHLPAEASIGLPAAAPGFAEKQILATAKAAPAQDGAAAQAVGGLKSIGLSIDARYLASFSSASKPSSASQSALPTSTSAAAKLAPLTDISARLAPDANGAPNKSVTSAIAPSVKPAALTMAVAASQEASAHEALGPAMRPRPKHSKR